MDEAASRNERPEMSPDETAAHLAFEKAKIVSRRHQNTFVIGADQTMECDGRSFDKPRDMMEARRHLTYLRGRTHVLHSAVCVIRDQKMLWSTVQDARLIMRDFDDGFLDEYLEQAGESILTSVGCYRLESHGAHLFSAIEGDFFTILGLPLLPLLGFFRNAEILH